MFILKFILKILILPLIAILSVLNIMGKLATNIIAFIAGAMMLILVICLIICISEGNVQASIMTVVFGLAGYAAVFASVLIDTFIGDANTALIRFLAS